MAYVMVTLMENHHCVACGREWNLVPRPSFDMLICPNCQEESPRQSGWTSTELVHVAFRRDEPDFWGIYE